MAKSFEQKMSTPPTGNPHDPVDEQLASIAQKEEHRKKRMKCFAYIAAFAVFQTASMLIFALTVMKVKAPKYRVRSATFKDFQVSKLSTNDSFNINMYAELSIKNTNFGRYKYQNITIEFFYHDFKVGETVVPRGRAKFRSTRKFVIPVDLSSANVRGEVLGNELRQHDWIPMTSQSTLKGKVTKMLIMKKSKSTSMNCTMKLNISSKQLQILRCK